MVRKSSPDVTATIARNLVRLLEERNLNQSDLAKMLGVAESSVTNWVNGLNPPKMGNIQKIADLFRISMSDILEEPTQTSRPTTNYRKVLMDRLSIASDEDVLMVYKIVDAIFDGE